MTLDKKKGEDFFKIINKEHILKWIKKKILGVDPYKTDPITDHLCPRQNSKESDSWTGGWLFSKDYSINIYIQEDKEKPKIHIGTVGTGQKKLDFYFINSSSIPEWQNKIVSKKIER